VRVYWVLDIQSVSVLKTHFDIQTHYYMLINLVLAKELITSKISLEVLLK
jgi:hypothetical protein